MPEGKEELKNSKEKEVEGTGEFAQHGHPTGNAVFLGDFRPRDERFCTLHNTNGKPVQGLTD